ncbi:MULTISPECIES: Hsp20/alpha crystallin family protein [Lactobacillus]|uniref:Hsp20/alpha crystallin family protein n=1 Tax=Lactobacillus xujianguonis TaxID=2495899 RepID=A0A437STW8_9LACO|nr:MULTISPECIES: Hsp20/alpha crystallin family protein [Lactobacillus]RVU70368.1 Hsp20/alpha crystallin family protein [Lactobacillus xujianguonis]RVU73475.1 Hsp20/alpha crystallin family protein [Lactobacillus xujianguonis]
MTNEMMKRRNDLFDAMNDWFSFPKNFFDDTEINNIMQADVAENDKEYTVKIDMPGLDKDKIKLSYNDGILRVAATRKSFKDESDKDTNIIHQERSVGHIARNFRLTNVVANQIHAKYDDGVLTVTLPKQTADSSDSSIQID